MPVIAALSSYVVELRTTTQVRVGVQATQWYRKHAPPLPEEDTMRKLIISLIAAAAIAATAGPALAQPPNPCHAAQVAPPDPCHNGGCQTQ